MRIEHEGISLWYRTSDAPAPQENVSEGKQITLTVGVSPPDASNRIEIYYRVNQGETQVISARYLPHSGDRRNQYFRASFPALSLGDIVEYTPVCRCAGRQVPPKNELDKFTSSFTVVEAGKEGKSDPKGIRFAGHVDVQKNQPTPANDQLKDTVSNPQSETVPDSAFSSKQGTTLPPLSTRNKKHLKNLTLGISEAKHKTQLEQIFAETEGDFNQFKARLEKREEFDPETIQKLTFNHEVAELLEDQENWITSLIQDNRIHCLRDIALNYKKEDFKSLIRTAGIPKDLARENLDEEDTELEDDEIKDAAIKKVESEEERLELCATRVCDRLFRMAPTAVVHRMVRDEEISSEDQNTRHGLLSFFENQPDLDFRKTSVLQVLQNPDCLKSVPEEHREKVTSSLKDLQRISVLSPKAEAVPTLMKANLTSAYAINEVPIESFVRLYGSKLGGQEVARTVHRNAQNITARNEEAYIALRQAVTGAPVRMIDGDNPKEARNAAVLEVFGEKNIRINFETLFGSVDQTILDFRFAILD